MTTKSHTSYMDDWLFIRDLNNSLHQKVTWWKKKPGLNQVSLKQGVRLEFRFPEGERVLDTAYQDFKFFLKQTGIAQTGHFLIITKKLKMDGAESHKIAVSPDRCEIMAASPEGIRRGLVYVEDEILRAGGPFLTLGSIVRQAIIRTRISRCFYSPKHRPPQNRDELMDKVNYYPDEYLNRLAHDGINGLWLTIRFAEICPSKIIPEYGHDSSQRLAKLRETVARCARYGIKIYPFCIEPRAFDADSPVLVAHPDLAGHRTGQQVKFCTSSSKGKAYLEEATYNLFSAIPDLGGLIVISVGERATHCYSTWSKGNNCPRCSKRQPWEVLSDTLNAMRRGIDSVNKNAELISWPYSQYLIWEQKAMLKSAENVPDGIILQHNFESGGQADQLGKTQTANDYWLSYIGPSKIFRYAAKKAQSKGTRVSAKLQVGCSHEVATVPFVPVPGNLYKKYRAMRRLGVSACMQCWYFGNYPSVMTKAAGELSFDPFPENETEFLMKLASRDWGSDAGKVVKAWKLFQKGYSRFPLNTIFSYFSPMQNGPIWPLHLVPKDEFLYNNCGNHPPCGDRIGECITYSHTLDEVLTLCLQMVSDWNRGVRILESLVSDYKKNQERFKDITVAKALGLQFQSGYNILSFYAIREELFRSRGSDKISMLDKLKTIVHKEIEIGNKLIDLCHLDSRLGFHSEAEAYKYSPEKIKWRTGLLKELLNKDFPMVRDKIIKGKLLFPEYTGLRPKDLTYHCRRMANAPVINGRPFGKVWDRLEKAECSYSGIITYEKYYKENKPVLESFKTFWRAGYDDQAIYFGFSCNSFQKETVTKQIKDTLVGKTGPFYNCECIEVRIEPKRLWPYQSFFITPDGARGHQLLAGKKDFNWSAVTCKKSGKWSATVRIPFQSFGRKFPLSTPIRVNIGRIVPDSDKQKESVFFWHQLNPVKFRGVHRNDNPKDFGWLIFE